MSMRVLGIVVAAGLIVSACSGGDGDGLPPPGSDGSLATDAAEDTTATEPPTSEAPSTDAPTTEAPTTLAPFEFPDEPTTVDRLVVTGGEEVVFDWTTDRCEDEHIPDIAPRAYRSADGQAQLTIGHYVTYRMIGPDLDNLVSDCSQPQLESDYDPDPARFNDSEWIGSTYTLDGETVYAVIHNEYRGDTHGAARPGQCRTGERLRCLDTSFTMAVSTDGGATFEDLAPAPDHLIATLPYPYDDDGVPSGIRQPSNIVAGPDGYFYLFGNISDQPNERQWVCAMRTRDLADPTSWRYWDGSGFDGEWGDPYRVELAPTDTCAPLADDQLSGSLNESVIFDERIGRFVSVGISFDPGGAPGFAVYYATSADLVEWTTRQLLLEVPVNNTVADPDNDTVHAYPALIDPDSASPNFETSDGRLYLYMSRFNFGGNSLDRDLLRWSVEFAPVEVPAPIWTFETDDDLQGWGVLNGVGRLAVADGVLSLDIDADDPALVQRGLTIPAVRNQLTIRMRVSEGGAEIGQLFFVTDADPVESESKSVVFDVIGDGEWHDYTVDLSMKPQWDGTITGLRLDPVGESPRTVDIDAVALTE